MQEVLTMIDVTTLRPDHISDIYALYRSQTDRLPHCLTSSEARFAADLARPEAGQILVAEAGGRALGFAALHQVTDDQDTEADSVTALFFADDDAGQALLEACVRRARPGPLLAFAQAHGHGPVQAYNGGWDGLSDRLAAQARLLVRSGLMPYYRELLLSCDLAVHVQLPPSVEGMELRGDIGEGGNLLQRAWIGDQRVGLCIYSTVQGASDDPRGARIGYIHWLWTDESLRRRGVARALLLHAMADLRARGCEMCWLGTGADNWAAQPLYLALGFAIVDGTVSFIRRAT
jgi:ribosomal protein S18 acetylase RimI-like enzyme